MNSPAPVTDLPKSVLRALCPVRRCADLKRVGERLCDRHIAAQPADLVAAHAAAFQHFIDVAEEREISPAMEAFEAVLHLERRIKMSIEQAEADNAPAH